jgi:hypothetical protein
MSNTHLGQEISNHVTLGAYGIIQPDKSLKWTYFRIYPNGTADYFTIPEGKVLVVTDVDWNYNTGERNQAQTLGILIKMPKEKIRNVIFASTVVGDANGAGGANVSMTAGFVVSSMSSIELTLESKGFLNNIVLRGYLIDFPESKKMDIMIKDKSHAKFVYNLKKMKMSGFPM